MSNVRCQEKTKAKDKQISDVRFQEKRKNIGRHAGVN